jgi:flagellar motor switch protein FliN
MSSSQMPSPQLESFIESLSGISVAAFLKTVDPNGNLDLADLQMQEQSLEIHLGIGVLCLRFEKPGGIPGYLVIHAGQDAASGPPPSSDQQADTFLRPFAEEIIRAGTNQLPLFRQCRLVDVEEAKQEMSLDSGDGCSVKFVAAVTGQGNLEVSFFLSPSLCASVEQPAQIQSNGNSVNRAQTTAPLVSVQPFPAPGPGNIDLIMDIELGITVSFGNARMLLKDVMQLGTGSIVELDRMADERVDLWVNNKRVARGEIVLVGGNYGVRISEVDGLVERINTLAG